MNFETSWNIDQYRNEREPDEQWQLRRKFLITHKMKYPKMQLLSLAQTFMNIEIHGCNYPSSTMILFENLSQGIADDFKENRKRELQKRFAAASNVTEARDNGNDQTAIEIINSGQPNVRKFNSTPYDADYILPGFMLVFRKHSAFQKSIDIINRSCSFCNIPRPEYQFNMDYESRSRIIQCSLMINNKLFVCGYAPTEKAAKIETARIALNILREKCFTIEEKDVNIQLIGESSTSDSAPIYTPVNSTDETDFPENNVGNKILKNMGWKQGTGLGKNNQGRLDPIKVVRLPRKVGLGGFKNVPFTTKKLSSFREKLREHFNKFIESPEKTLKLPYKFSEYECKMICKLCSQYNLKFKSLGRKGRRHVLIYKLQNIRDVFYDLIHNDCENEYYILKKANN